MSDPLLDAAKDIIAERDTLAAKLREAVAEADRLRKLLNEAPTLPANAIVIDKAAKHRVYVGGKPVPNAFVQRVNFDAAGNYKDDTDLGYIPLVVDEVVNTDNPDPDDDGSGDDVPPLEPTPTLPAQPIDPTKLPTATKIVRTVPQAIAALSDGERVVRLDGNAVMAGKPLEPGKGQTLIITGRVTGSPNGPAAMVKMHEDDAKLFLVGTLDSANVVNQVINCDKARGMRLYGLGRGQVLNSPHNGISGHECEDLIIDGLLLDNVGGIGGHAVYFTGWLKAVQLLRCDIKGRKGSFHRAKFRANGVDGTELRNILIAHNTFRDVGSGEVIAVDDHDLPTNGGKRRCFDIIIKDNRFIEKADGKNIRLHDCERGLVSGNTGVGHLSLDNNVGVEVR